ncbi:MAG: oxidoreductase, partial [Sciscionella sp.]
MAAGLPAPPHGAVLDANDPDPPSWAALPAAQVVALITEADSGGRIGRRRTPSVPPVLLIEDRYLTGTLDLRALELPYLLEFRRCRFERGPDFRQAKLAGVEFDSCYLPGLLGRNLHTDNDLILRNCTVSAAPIDLTDGDLGGTLELSSSTLHNPDARAVHANRLTISGALLASKLTVDGELRMPGLRVGGNVNFHGSTLRNPSGFTLMIGGADIGGNLLCNSDPETRATFFSHGLIYLVSAEIHTDLVLRGAELVPKSSLDIPPPDGDPYYDAACSVLADRARVDGNVLCDIGLRCTGTLRMLNATVSGSLRLAGSSIDVSAGAEPPYPHRALHLDGCEVRGDLNARRMHILGQARLSNLSVGGSVSLEAATLHNPTQVVIEARRFVVSGNLDCREMTGTGSVQLQGARIGATVDLRDATLTETGYHTADGTPRPSLDLSTATIGRDLLCGSTQGTFRAAGGVRMHSTSIGREVNFSGALLGSDGAEQALNAFSMRCQDLVLTPAAPPVGRVDLSYVRCASLADNAQFWAAPSRIQLEDFRYQALAQPLEIGDDASVHTRLGWLFAAMNKRYAP